MEKQTYYVSVVHLTCSPHAGIQPYDFAIRLEPHIARVFQKIFQQLYRMDSANAFRAHLPYIPYHYDELNHTIDHRYKMIYALLHEFGDAETRKFVEQLPYFS